MLKGIISFCAISILLLFTCPAYSTTLIDSLVKSFKTIGYPENEVVARITFQTDIPQITGDRTEDSVLLAYKIQNKLVSTFLQNGWQTDDSLQVDIIDAGIIELELGKGMTLGLKETLRLKAYIHQCDPPMRKYRGGSLDEFFKKQVLETSERCFTYDEKLQGKNYPY